MLFLFHRHISGKEFKIFPPLFFGFEKPVLAIPNLAHLLLPSSDANADAKSKELNPTTQIGVLRTFFARALSVPQRSSRQREFHPKPLTEPYLKFSLHTALVIQAYKTINRPLIKHSWVTDLNFL